MPTPRRFNPNRLRYDKDGIPVMTAAAIEDVATEVLEVCCPRVLTEPVLTPVIEIIKHLQTSTGMKFAYGDLGFNKVGAKILGKVSLKDATLSLDESLNGSMQVAFRFTAAHEIGHWVLHRYRYGKWKFHDAKQSDLEDDADTLCRLQTKTPLEWLEFQANVFAASLVMPRATFETALAREQYALGIRRNLGLVYLTNNLGSQLDYIMALDGLRKVYDVSKTSLRVRVETLGLVESSSRLIAPTPFAADFDAESNEAFYAF